MRTLNIDNECANTLINLDAIISVDAEYQKKSMDYTVFLTLTDKRKIYLHSGLSSDEAGLIKLFFEKMLSKNIVLGAYANDYSISYSTVEDGLCPVYERKFHL